MLARKPLYYGFLYYQKRLPVRQFVMYVGKEVLQMEQALEVENMTFSYRVVDLRSFSYWRFLESNHSEEVLLAILADFQGEPADLIGEKIIAKLEELSEGKLELSQRAVQLIRLAVLRNLDKTVFNAAQKMAITIDVKEDTLYQLGKEAASEEAAVSMLKEGFSEEDVVRITKLPTERIMQLKQQLENGH